MLNANVTKKLYVREWIFPLMFVVFAIVLEMVNFLTLGIGILPKYLIFDLAIICLFLGVLFLFKTGGVAWICVASFFLLIQVALNMVNATLNNVFGDIFSLSMLNLGVEGANAFKFEFLDLVSILVNLLIYGLFIFSAIYLNKNTECSMTLTKQSKFTIVLSAFIALMAGGFSLFNAQIQTIRVNAEIQEENLDEPFSDEELWDNMFLKTESLQMFGTYGFYLKNLGDFLFSGGEMSEEDQAKVKEALKSGENYVAQSQYSGIGTGDNLIIIMLESFDSFSIDPIYTPFLWSMRMGEYDGAQYMNSFYARNKTNISEEISIVGHIANEKLYSGYCSGVGINQPYSLPNLMKQVGATAVNFFHGYTKTFYDRENVNVALGFNNVYGIEDCTLENITKGFGDWILDSDYIENMVDLFIPDGKRFYSQYTTISTHGPYDYNNPRIADNLNYVEEHFDEYLNYVNNYTNLQMPTDENLLKKYKQFKAFTMDTDKMVQYIFKTLKEKGILDKTTIVMYADHNAYYSDMCYHIKGVEKDDYSNIEGNHLPCIIYNDELPKMINNTYCSTYDLYPTICDLLGLSYNSTLTQGYSIFSEDIKNTVFVSSLSGMYVQNIYTSNIKDFIALDDSVTQEDIDKFKENLLKYYDKQEIIELIYQYNYFKNYA